MLNYFASLNTSLVSLFEAYGYIKSRHQQTPWSHKSDVTDHPGCGAWDRPSMKRFFAWFPGNRSPKAYITLLGWTGLHTAQGDDTPATQESQPATAALIGHSSL